MVQELKNVMKMNELERENLSMVAFHEVHEGMGGEAELRIGVANQRLDGLEKAWIDLWVG